ncbi:response regulator [Devosia sp. MC521]|nr:response regulator [Devosia sp. MC521]MBK1793782.1 response regulator [Devosia sp. WQ 349K1]QMW61683.1 response regulator [Devosia sp. MC521]
MARRRAILANPSGKIFVVEDETLVLFNLEDILEDLGFTIVGEAMWIDQAQSLAASVEQPDAAILDVNIGGSSVFPVAKILADRGVPILFATGYGREGLSAEWQDSPVVSKPYTQADISNALNTLLKLN